MSGPPRVSVVIPAYRSQATIGGCLEALARQTAGGFETVVVDSSPDGATAEVVRRHPEARLERSALRLLPHAARNRGVDLARGDVLVFTDPDVYPRPDWLATLLATHAETAGPVVGALGCYGARWLDLGIHLTKFANWLPDGRPGTVDNAPTANLLCSRAHFAAVGGFRDDLMAGDTLFSWRLALLAPIRFEPRAVVEHDHLCDLGGFFRERFVRGVEFAGARRAFHHHGRRRDLLFLAVSALPVRLGRILARTARLCRRARLGGAFLRTLPLIVAGHSCWLAGESLGYLRGLTAAGTPCDILPPSPALAVPGEVPEPEHPARSVSP